MFGLVLQGSFSSWDLSSYGVCEMGPTERSVYGWGWGWDWKIVDDGEKRVVVICDIVNFIKRELEVLFQFNQFVGDASQGV